MSCVACNLHLHRHTSGYKIYEIYEIYLKRYGRYKKTAGGTSLQAEVLDGVDVDVERSTRELETGILEVSSWLLGASSAMH